MRSRFASKIKGLIGFQENIWLMLNMSFNTARKKWKNKTKSSNGIIDLIDISRQTESEDKFYKLQWTIVTIKGDEKGETEEFNEANDMYKDLKGILKNHTKFEQNDKLTETFKSKLISKTKLEEAYSKGYGASKDKNVANILLEMGIITHIEWIKDYETRNVTPDF